MQTHQITPHAAPGPVTPHQHALYCQLRHATALAGGLEAIATQALDAGGVSDDQLDHIAELSTHLTAHLTAITYEVAEAPASP